METVVGELTSDPGSIRDISGDTRLSCENRRPRGLRIRRGVVWGLLPAGRRRAWQDEGVVLVLA